MKAWNKKGIEGGSVVISKRNCRKRFAERGIRINNG